ncbi:MAG TPA: hypothetical protein VFS92_06850, partial [Planctomycetota bacterium]|nr:hypothetical protein [Planctomycetota bacterium]
MRAWPAAAALLAGCAAAPAGPSALESGRAALAALAARSAPDGDPATVDLLVAADEAFLALHGPDAARVLEEAVAAADRALGEAAGVRFRIGGAAPFPSTPDSRDDLRLLWEARLSLRRGACDAAAAFTGQRCGARAGAAVPELRLLLCADPDDPARNLAHEAAHLFGAQDLGRDHPGYASPSLMSYDADQPRTLALDAVNLARVRARAGRLPPPARDHAAEALAARLAALAPEEGAALRDALLGAESRISHEDGLEAAARLLAARPGDAAGRRAEAECLRVLRRGSEAAPRFAASLEAVASAASPPDGLDRHGVLETARLAVDGVDGLAPLRPAAESALARLDAAFPGDAEVLDLRASLRARAGDRPAAERLYRAAMEAAPAAVFPRRHLASLGKSSGDAALWLEGWRAALGADPLDPVLGVQFVEDGLSAFPAAIRGPARDEARAALDAAARAWPAWDAPA